MGILIAREDVAPGVVFRTKRLTASLQTLQLKKH